ncbi:hypothetical protein PSM36_2501 [Proteiniphilum saccharofermentans]|uniref:Uncharacterized protein n=1 Tax=Proteiniphilum saccharofermentans TaxID=1642647 RepID=A0A1R3T530_9BACT|nr:hypothetical protein [Proteiniphilum saccharofermentans]SCD21302.1 hypothetical protein PSM36_2501 [Proteiniphilum saccharofermentans]
MFKYIISLLFFILFSCSPKENSPRPLSVNETVKGWIILSDDVHEDSLVIEKSLNYSINHLQISHHLIHDLKHVRDPKRLEKADILTKYAHSKGIQEVVLWDRSLYELDYYPDQFKTGPKGTINLDDDAFWEWFKDDYREMLNLAPNIQGLVLTFIETGARVEDQYSEKLKSNQEKLAAVVNAIASVVIEERGLNLYARTFSYTYKEYENIIGAIELFEYPEIRLMMKETPHDFFLTHPNDFLAGTINRPTIIEFDTGAEFNGQGIIANTWPEHILDRWSDFLNRDHIIGYTARTDRYGDTRIVGRPSEINLYALKRYLEDRSLTSDDIYDEFITLTYNEEALPFIKNAFKNSFDIITSILYTLGTSTANHSSLNYDPYPSHWARHVSGKWLDPPVVYVEHEVDRGFHYWRDIINILAPDWAKAGGTQLYEIPWVIDNEWLTRGEKMNEEFLSYVMTEKEYGVSLAEASLFEITKAKPYLSEDQYTELFDYFNRTLITARLHKAVSTLYFGYRIYAKGLSYQNPKLIEIIGNALDDCKEISGIIKNYNRKVPIGQWNWKEDANMALQYCDWIENGTWPNKTRGYSTNLNGIAFTRE